MAINIVTPTIDIAEIVFRAVLNELPDESKAFLIALDAIDDNISSEDYNRIINVFMDVLGNVQETAFRAGWTMRAQV